MLLQSTVLELSGRGLLGQGLKWRMGWARAELWSRLISGPLQEFAVTTTGFFTAEQKSGLPLLRAETQILVFGLRLLSGVQML